ncbi:TIGR00366 family protein [Halobium salinum]|uniref:TIGR00366 family protein n=1 Tax=Halobium salinum TaxID=1364940 RepID=A0ABD5P8Y5_9EURY|nr:TIGR00366 family protein [Halobium salinum]
MATEESTTDGATRSGPYAGDGGPTRFVPEFGSYHPTALALAALLALAVLLATLPRLGLVTGLEQLATGFYGLFAVQMALVLWWVLSATAVESPYVGAALDRLAATMPAGPRSAVAGTALLGLVLGWVNWALGLVGAVLVGRRLCRRAADAGTPVHYPAVLVGALLSLVTATVGLTSPAALLMADESGTTNFLADSVGVVPLGAFVLHPANLVVLGAMLVTLPAGLALVAPTGEGDRDASDDDGRSGVTTVDEVEPLLGDSIRNVLARTGDEETESPETDVEGDEETVPADRLERSRLLTAVVVAVGAVSIGWQWLLGANVSLLGVLFALMMLGMATQVRPLGFVAAASDATRWVEHLVVPFLLYGGVYALLSESELYAPIGDALAATGLPAVASYLAALGLGLLVPDPGSVWVLLAPAATTTAAGADALLVSTMYGAGVSNLWVGFIFLGVLGVRGFGWRRYLTYAAGLTVYLSALVGGALLLF